MLARQINSNGGDRDLRHLSREIRKLIWAAQKGRASEDPDTELRLHRALALLWAAVDIADGSTDLVPSDR